MKKLNLQLERKVFDWARAEAARLNLDLSGLVEKILLADPKFKPRRKRWPRRIG
jgi:hypothetical protein